MEEKTNEKGLLKSPKKQARYDKRLVLEIVKQIEAGMPRKLANEEYGLGKSTLSLWMKAYGSKTYQKNKRKAYSNLDKSAIVASIEQGRMTIKEAGVAYGGCSENTIRKWLSKSILEKGNFNIPVQLDMAKRKNIAEKINPGDIDLQKALQEAQLKIIALNTLIDVAEEQLKIEIRKKSGARRSSK